MVLGRPVKYSPDAAVSERAQEIMYKAARLAGFETIGFEMEPIGALYFYHRTSPKRELALVFDFGGGTLDLTLAEVGGATPPNIIATLGVLVGGDDLDKRLMQSLFKYFGGMPRPGRRAVPPYLLDFLENWQTMPLLSRPHMLKMLDQYRADNPVGHRGAADAGHAQSGLSTLPRDRTSKDTPIECAGATQIRSRQHPHPRGVDASEV